MIELVRAELLKVWTTRLWIGMAIGAVGLTGLSTILFLALAHSANAQANGIHPIETAEDLRTLVFQASGTLAFVLVLAATMATAEFRYGTASGTYLAAPSRMRVITAKSIAAASVGLLYGVAAATITLVIAVIWLAGQGTSIPVGASVIGAIGQEGLRCAYGAALAVGVGAALRSQLVAILGLLGWLFIVEPLGTALLPRFAKFMPFAGVAGAFGHANDTAEVFGWAGALVLAVVWIISVWASAVSLERRRDV
jgi:ABC-2 type transport system permease protein